MEYKYCPQCLAAAPSNAPGCVHCGWQPGTPAYPDLNRTLVIPAWGKDSLPLPDGGSSAGVVLPPSAGPGTEWLGSPKAATPPSPEAHTPSAPAAAAAVAAAEPDILAQTVADVPSSQVSAQEINLLTEPLLEEEEPPVRHGARRRSARWHLVLRVLGALTLAAALMLLVRANSNFADEQGRRIVGMALAFVGLVFILLPNVLRAGRRPHGKSSLR